MSIVSSMKYCVRGGAGSQTPYKALNQQLGAGQTALFFSVCSLFLPQQMRHIWRLNFTTQVHAPKRSIQGNSQNELFIPYSPLFVHLRAGLVLFLFYVQHLVLAGTLNIHLNNTQSYHQQALLFLACQKPPVLIFVLTLKLWAFNNSAGPLSNHGCQRRSTMCFLH